jgi:hypothetical protein
MNTHYGCKRKNASDGLINKKDAEEIISSASFFSCWLSREDNNSSSDQSDNKSDS